MLKFRATTPFGLFRLMDMGEIDILDALEAVPEIAIAHHEREELARREERRIAWLEQYQPGFDLNEE